MSKLNKEDLLKQARKELRYNKKMIVELTNHINLCYKWEIHHEKHIDDIKKYIKLLKGKMNV